MDLENYTFISNREKGIPQAISERFEQKLGPKHFGVYDPSLFGSTINSLDKFYSR